MFVFCSMLLIWDENRSKSFIRDKNEKEWHRFLSMIKNALWGWQVIKDDLNDS